MPIDSIRNWLADINANYGINSIIFAVIYFGSAIPFWFSIYKVITGLKNRNYQQVRIFSIILGIAIIAPFVYVALFGRNVPFWFWMFAGIIIGYSAFSALRRFKKRTQ